MLCVAAGCVNSHTYGSADIASSAIGTDFAYLYANGNDTARITVTVKTGAGIPVSGLQVILSAGDCNVTQPAAPTDANGQAMGLVASSAPGSFAVQAEIGRADFSATLSPTEVLVFFASDSNNPAVAGEPIDVPLLPRDANTTALQPYTGVVTFRSSDIRATLPTAQTFAAADTGHRVLAAGAIFRTTGLQTLVGTDGATGRQVVKLTYLVAPGSATIMVLTPSATAAVAGVPLTVDTRVVDSYGNDAVGYTGTVALRSYDPLAVLPEAYTYQATDAGQHTFEQVQLRTAGIQKLTAVDTAQSILNGEVPLTVLAGPVAIFAFAGNGNAVAGVAYPATVQPQDAYGNAVVDYSGTVLLAVDDANATLPSRVDIVAGNAASQNVLATFEAAGNIAVHLRDTSLDLAHNATVTVVGGAFDHLAWSGLPAMVAAGATTPLQLQAFDTYGNLSSLYRGIVSVSISDPAGTLSANSFSFTSASAGVADVTVMFKSRGAQSVSANDAVTEVISTATTTVEAGTVTQRLAVTGVPALVTAGQGFNVTLQAIDVYGNTQTDYNGTVRLTCSDPNARCPAPVTFFSMGNGNVQVPGVVFSTQGAQTFTATDARVATITGNANLTVQAGPAAALKFMRAPATVQACQLFGAPVVVGASDTFGNPVPIPGPVTLALVAAQNVTTPPQIAGVLTVAPSGGVADFTTLSIARAGTGYALLATAAGLLPARSGTFAVVATMPMVTGAQVTGQSGVVDVSFHAANACPISYGVAYDPNHSGVFFAATQPAGASPSSNLTVGTAGADLMWQWDSSLNLPNAAINTLDLQLTVGTANSNTVLQFNNLTLNNAPTFANITVLNQVASVVTCLTSADVNYDGATDFAGCDPTGYVRLWYGSAAKSFAVANTRRFAAGGVPTALALADMNRDGLLDLVVAVPGLGAVQVLLATSTTSYAPPIALSMGAAPTDVAVADINEDGFLDVVVADAAPDNLLAWAYGDGTGHLGSVYSTATARAPAQLLLADVNRDSWKDAVLLSRSGAAINVMLGSAAGFAASLPAIATAASPVALAVGNITNRGQVDLVVAYDAAVDVRASNGNGTFAPPQSFTAASGTTGLSVQDVTRDGVPDAVLTSGSAAHAWTVLPGVRGTGFTSGASTAYGAGLTAALAADVDHDAVTDLVGMGADGNLLVSPGHVPASSGHGLLSLIATRLAHHVDLAEGGDFNEDGYMDMLVVSTTDQVYDVLFGDGSGALTDHGAIGVAAPPAGVVVADFNGDGHLDQALGSLLNGEVDIRLGSGDGNFTLAASLFLGNGAAAMSVADFNEDGKLDLAVLLPQSSIVVVLLGDGQGHFFLGQRVATDLAPEGVACNDVNNDGHADIVTTNAALTTAASMLGNGKGAFGAPVITGSALCGARIFLRDFDLDGNLDLWYNCSGMIGVNFGDGHGGFPNQNLTHAGGWGEFDFDVGDIDLDGRTDAAMPAVVFFPLLSHAGGFYQTGSYAPNFGLGRLVDMNGDGLLDMVGIADTRVMVNFNQGQGIYTNADTSDWGAFDPLNVLTRDIDRDGYADLALASVGDAGTTTPRVTQVNIIHNDQHLNFHGTTALQVHAGYYNTGLLAAGDVNHDGWPDIFLSDWAEGAVFGWMSTGGGAYNPNAIMLAVNYPWQVDVRDLNQDGNRDVVVGSAAGVQYAAGNGDGTFQTFTALLTGASPTTYFAMADLDHNGADDVVATFQNAVLVQLLDTSGAALGPVPSGTYPLNTAQLVNLADMNLDGQADMVISTSANSGGFAIALGAGDGSFGSFTSTAITDASHQYSIQQMVVADITSDGNPDVVLAVYSGAAIVYPATSLGVLGAPVYLGAGNDTVDGVAIGQFNNDGYPDLVTTNSGYAINVTFYLGR